MMKKIFTFLCIALNLYGVEFQPIHSSMQLYFESKDFDNSKQKIDGVVYGIGGDLHIQNSEIRFAYERGKTQTKQPPLRDDLDVEKLFLRYAYAPNKSFALNLNYLTVLHDNIAITDGGDAYGAGISYFPSKKLGLNFTQYYTDYKDFDVYQSNVNIDFKIQIGAYKIKLTSENLYINIDEENQNTFTKNAKESYFTSAVKLHAHYNSWHFGTAAYFGKRAFAIMNDGLKLQHHAMEFDRAYAVGVGKSIGNAVVRLQYIYQRATELPLKNENVEVKNIRAIVNYKF
ncbi:MAG TPA: hypothetical protein EYG74_01760 [Sulfurimonas autotrophica]|nr:hypothetical protein [Sulfurimonas autotrophica]